MVAGWVMRKAGAENEHESVPLSAPQTMEQEPAPSEVDEVRDLVSQTLESKGVLAKIRVRGQ